MLNTSFATMNFGSAGPIPAKLEVIKVSVDPTIMVDQYAEAFVKEARRVAPLIFDREDLTEEEMKAYARYILKQRVLYVKGACKDYQRCKLLNIPSFLQYAISMIGDVTIRNKGLKLVPEYDDEVITIEKALEISNKIAAFNQHLQIVDDAMPRDTKGDVDVMSTALIAGYAMSIEKVEHESSAYVASFLGFKLQEEMAFRVLYRVQYDDIGYITSAIMSRRELY